MGNPIYKLKCKDCGKDYKIYEGFDSNGKFCKAYYCSNCKEFKDKIFKNDEDENQNPQFCTKCHSKLEELNINIPEADNISICSIPATVTPQVHCPHCKSENVEIFFNGLWD